ncbi:SWI-SNF complex subunit [Ascosphaera apis ARSEF 7405]|uniref:SWI-SNF complex subunit n=1 Tax=Ascosphaera apis ARSEF 7405 TaxID=392613 RepID=A0A168AYU1_9EURO|nr:SWI-SNF complex subunit [Ascosphaera apis ARSEF 7405]
MAYTPSNQPIPGNIPPNYRGYTSAAAAQAMQQQQQQQQQRQQALAQAQAQAQAQAAAMAGMGPGQVPVQGQQGGAGRRGMQMMMQQPTAPPPSQHPIQTPIPPTNPAAAAGVAAPQGMSTLPGHPPPTGSSAAVAAAVAAAQPQQPAPIPSYLLTSHRTQPSPAEHAARRARKPTSRAIPPGVSGVIIGDGVEEYKKLREVERRLDGVMMRKRMDLGDAVAGRKGRDGKVRIWIGQEVVGGEEEGGKRVRVKIEGRVLDGRGRAVEEGGEESGDDDDESEEEEEEEGEKNVEKKNKKNKEMPRLRFSQFFKSITVEFEKPASPTGDDLLADTTPVTWTRPPQQQQPPSSSSTTDFDSITFTRTTSTNLHATLHLTPLDQDPETTQYTLSPPLAYILDRTQDTRSNIIVGLYEYIRALNLQESEERRSVRCDEPLRVLFGGQEKIYFTMIPDVVAAHTSVVGDVKVPFTLRVDLPNHNDNEGEKESKKVEETVYDISVTLPPSYDPITRTLNNILSDPSYPSHLQQITSLDDQLAFIIQALGHSKAKHAFLTGYAEDPAGFIRRWISSQKRDMSIILGEGENGEGILPGRYTAAATDGGDGEEMGDVVGAGLGLGEEFRRGGENGAWDTPVAREAVRYMLAKPVRGR